MTPATVDELLAYWPGNIPFKGSLISDDGSCMCAQGQALHFLAGYTPKMLRSIKQLKADTEVARLFGISRAQSVLLRIVNDTLPGAPSAVIRDPASIVGDQWAIIDAFWRHIDRMTADDWLAFAAAGAAAQAAARAAARAAAWDAALAAARDAAGAAAQAAARAAARAAAWDAALAAARAAAWDAAVDVARAAVGATNEIQGAAVMRERGQPFFFLPMFGFEGPGAVIASPLAQGASQ